MFVVVKSSTLDVFRLSDVTQYVRYTKEEARFTRDSIESAHLYNQKVMEATGTTGVTKVIVSEIIELQLNEVSKTR